MKNAKLAPDWQRRLNQYILDAQERLKKKGFQYGKFDCCTFASDWVKIATGKDPMADYRGKYKSAASAVRALKNGRGTLYKELVARFGKPVPGALARRGWLAWDGERLGIFLTSGAKMLAVFLTEDGFTPKRARDVKGFKIV